MGADNGDVRTRGQGSSSNSGSTSGHDELADLLSRLARSLEEDEGVESTLSGIVHAAVATVPGAQYASISQVRRGREVQTLAATGELPRAIDHAQYDTGEGPCLDSLWDEQTVRLSNPTTETRWPDFLKRARELGTGSMLAVQLFVNVDALGALNLTSEKVNAFDDESEHIALLFAAHAAVAMSNEQDQHDLRAAVRTREVIGQAQGVLMERFKLPATAAFRLLVRASQDTNRKLYDIADELSRTGQLPGR